MVYDYVAFVKQNGYFDYRRSEQAKYWMYETINEQLRNHFYHNAAIQQRLAEAERVVLEGQKTSFAAAGELLESYFQGSANS